MDLQVTAIEEVEAAEERVGTAFGAGAGGCDAGRHEGRCSYGGL